MAERDETMLAREWMWSHGLVERGFVLFVNGKPCEWQEHRRRACNNIATGTVNLDVLSGERWVATDCGSGRYWKRDDQASAHAEATQ